MSKDDLNPRGQIIIPASWRIIGPDAQTPGSMDVVAASADTINGFVFAARQRVNTSSIDIHKATFTSPDIDVTYHNQFGSERIELTPYVRRPVIEHEPDEPINVPVPETPFIPFHEEFTHPCLLVLYGTDKVAAFDMSTLGGSDGKASATLVYQGTAKGSAYGDDPILNCQLKFNGTTGIIFTGVDLTGKTQSQTYTCCSVKLSDTVAGSLAYGTKNPVMNSDGKTVWTPSDSFAYGPEGITAGKIGSLSDTPPCPYAIGPDGTYYYGQFYDNGFPVPTVLFPGTTPPALSPSALAPDLPVVTTVATKALGRCFGAECYDPEIATWSIVYQLVPSTAPTIGIGPYSASATGQLGQPASLKAIATTSVTVGYSTYNGPVPTAPGGAGGGGEYGGSFGWPRLSQDKGVDILDIVSEQMEASFSSSSLSGSPTLVPYLQKYWDQLDASPYRNYNPNGGVVYGDLKYDPLNVSVSSDIGAFGAGQSLSDYNAAIEFLSNELGDPPYITATGAVSDPNTAVPGPIFTDSGGTQEQSYSLHLGVGVVATHKAMAGACPMVIESLEGGHSSFTAEANLLGTTSTGNIFVYTFPTPLQAQPKDGIGRDYVGKYEGTSTPYEIFDPNVVGLTAFVHASNGQHVMQGYVLTGDPTGVGLRIYTDGADDFAPFLLKALGCASTDIKALYMDIDLSTIETLHDIVVPAVVAPPPSIGVGDPFGGVTIHGG